MVQDGRKFVPAAIEQADEWGEEFHHLRVAATAFDNLDRGLLHAPQIDGRPPLRRIGEVLGVSDQTVARRYARLRAAQALRVLALRDPADEPSDTGTNRANLDVTPSEGAFPGMYMA